MFGMLIKAFGFGGIVVGACLLVYTLMFIPSGNSEEKMEPFIVFSLLGFFLLTMGTTIVIWIWL